MILVKRILPVLVGGLVLLGLLFLVLAQSYIWAWGVAVLLIVLWGLGVMSGWGTDMEKWGLLAITPVLFVASAIGFMLFLETQWVLVTVSVAVAIFVAFYLEHVFRFVHAPGLYQPYALEHTSIVLHVASVYFFSTVFYGLNTFLHIPVWILAVLFFILSSVFVFETLWVSKIASNIAISRALLGGLLLMELFVAVAFLPTSFFVNASATAVAFYVFLGIVRSSLLQKLSSSALKHYAVTGAVFLLLVLLSAKWV